MCALSQTDRTNGELSPVHQGSVHKPEAPIVHPATADSPEPPPPPSPTKTTSDGQLVCGECSSPKRSGELESAALGQPPGSSEESDEQIEKLLEDIMMGLNILPNSERDCKSPRHPQLSQEGAPAVCQDTVSEKQQEQSEVHAVSSAAGCVYCEDFSSKNPGMNVCICGLFT